ncbi:DUF2892 domain-containing protein [soil metagenome]
MKTNESNNDRAIRVVLGMSISSFFIYHNSAWAMIGLIPFITGVVGFCPLYALLGMHTTKE